MGALGSFFNNLYVRLGLRKTPAAGEPVASPAEDDFVARHGRSYGEDPDRLSAEQRFELERLKSLPRNRR
jgi:hypothetical protein